ncbi:MAG: fibronectin type III domain-containing protein, partial [Okeania sp. SIO4D6]|nr:fibronectin type III domain-containing protein [Okeania sp. SIO4D6]
MHVTGLDPGSTYQFRVQARNLNGDGPSSQPVTVTTMAAPWTGSGLVDRSFVDRFPD